MLSLGTRLGVHAARAVGSLFVVTRTSATFTRRRCCSPGCPYTWSRHGSVNADPSVTLRVYAHVIQELTPAVAATFAGAIEAAIQGDPGASVSSGVSYPARSSRRSVGQTGSD